MSELLDEFVRVLDYTIEVIDLDGYDRVGRSHTMIWIEENRDRCSDAELELAADMIEERIAYDDYEKELLGISVEEVEEEPDLRVEAYAYFYDSNGQIAYLEGLWDAVVLMALPSATMYLNRPESEGRVEVYDAEGPVSYERMLEATSSIPQDISDQALDIAHRAAVRLGMKKKDEES